MAIEIFTIGGYSEVGKNMNAVKVGDEIIILDAGFHMQKIVDYEDGGNSVDMMDKEQLLRIGAIPDDSVLEKFRDKVSAIACTHCHLDHSGGLPYIAPDYNAPIIGTSYTIEVLRNLIQEKGLHVKNQLKVLNAGHSYHAGNFEVEFIGITHSTPQTVMIALHTKEGVVLYTNDFKLDNHPVIGHKPDLDRLKRLKNENVKAVIVDALYSRMDRKTPSEKVAREMLKDVILGVESNNHNIIATCFASNIARLKSIVDFGKKLNRRIVFFGRSLSKYVRSADQIGIIDFVKDIEIFDNEKSIQKQVNKMEKLGMSNYLIVCTGGQGEPKSVLSKMMNKVIHFDFMNEDHVIFSNSVIPVEPNISNREKVERKLKNFGVRLFKDIHSSGHASREDIRDLIRMINPEHIIPSHGDRNLVEPMVELGREMGYSKKEVHLMEDNQKLVIE